MQILKYILLVIIFSLSAGIGFTISKIYENRVKELREFQNILNFMKTKIKFTYEPLLEIFTQIEKAEEEKKKNQKMYKTLGVVVGLVFCIILF